jgi:hypothetical protein
MHLLASVAWLSLVKYISAFIVLTLIFLYHCEDSPTYMYIFMHVHVRLDNYIHAFPETTDISLKISTPNIDSTSCYTVCVMASIPLLQFPHFFVTFQCAIG